MTSPHTPARAAVAGALLLGLGLAAQPAHATQPAPATASAQTAGPDTKPVAVINGDFALPAFTGTGPNWAAVQGWSVGSTNGSGTSSGVARYADTVSGHPDGKTAVMLRLPNAATHSFKQRLRGVRAGAQVTVTFDDSPSVAAVCTPEALAQGQTYTVEGDGGQASTQTTAPDPNKKPRTLGTGVWRTGQTYTFTAGEHEPLLTFTSQVPATDNARGDCGPLIANVRAAQIPPPVDKTIPKTALPASQAFYGNDRRPVADAVNHCASAPGTCSFTPQEDYSYTYYEPAKANGDTYINCTRNALTRNRPVTVAGRSYGDLPAKAGLPGSAGAASSMAQQFAAGSGTAPSWATSITHNVTEVVQPAEASWVETQAGRRRTEGWFTTSPAPADPHTEWRLHTVLDYPATELSDRLYQRTGPMTGSEKQRCQSNRPTATTPVGADAPAGFDRAP
ncbi:hypothetical protein [Streptosporangium sp. NPDC002607]